MEMTFALTTDSEIKDFPKRKNAFHRNISRPPLDVHVGAGASKEKKKSHIIKYESFILTQIKKIKSIYKQILLILGEEVWTPRVSLDVSMFVSPDSIMASVHRL